MLQKKKIKKESRKRKIEDSPEQSNKVEIRPCKKNKDTNNLPRGLDSTIASTTSIAPKPKEETPKLKCKESPKVRSSQTEQAQTKEEIITIPSYGFIANHQTYIYYVFWVVASFGGVERLNRQPYFEMWAKVADHKLIALPKGKVSVTQSRGQKLQDFFYRYELDLFSKWLCGITERSL